MTSADEIVASNKLTADQSDKTDVELIEQDAQKSLSLVKLIESMRLVIERMLNEGELNILHNFVGYKNICLNVCIHYFGIKLQLFPVKALKKLMFDRKILVRSQLANF